ncbi:ATP-binding protein [Fretibacter rubidus]|uniref:ATP-binding protein n=1 Tax=Fretibacter rubidus TaxID=570162 RepID=UPI00352BB631
MDIQEQDAIYDVASPSINPNLVAGFERLMDSALIIIEADLSISYYNQLAIDMMEFPASLLNDSIKVYDAISYMAERGDFGPGNPSDFIDLASDLLANIQAENEKRHQSYLTMPSGKVLRVRAVRNKDGSLILSAFDCSKQKRRNDILDMAMNIGAAGYWVLEKDDSTVDIHSDYLRSILTSRELQTIEAAGIWPLFHADDLPRAKQLWKSACSEGLTQEGTMRISTYRMGVRWMRFHLRPLVSEKDTKTGIACFFYDVTDNLRQQDSLRQAKSDAEETLKSKNNFLARMSHEIRTPMNGVIGIADALIHHHADPAITPKLELIQTSATNILKILDETLDHTKLGSENFTLNPTPASPAKVVRDVCSLWEQQALKNGGFIRCIIKPDVPEQITFDRFRYEQCVNNLLSNAVKFTPKGQIDVILTTIQKAGHPRRLILAVRDTGIGMTTEQQANIFEAYAQGDKSISSRFGGTGLGMNITKQIIELMGGSISVKSQIGNGSIFALSFPIEEAVTEDAASSDIAAAGSNAQSNGLVDQMLERAKPEPSEYSALRILVVDDNATNHMVISSLLSSLVSDIYTANNGREALDVLATTDVDIVLMDIHMPVMDGIEATIAIRSCEKPWKDVQIIALTADPQYQQKKLCLNIGMDDALAKPVKLNDVLEAIDSVLPAVKAKNNNHGKEASHAA